MGDLVVDTSTGEARTGRVEACSKCGHFACVCKVLVDHKEGCAFRLSATCSTPIECDHGFDVCPTCDPCTCDV